MPHIVKSSLGIESTIIPWNEREKQKLIKEKKEYLEKENKEVTEEVIEKRNKLFNEEKENKEVIEEKVDFKDTKKKQKVGEK